MTGPATGVGDRVRDHTWILFGFVAIGVVLAAVAVLIGGRASAADPAYACPTPRPPGILALEFAGNEANAAAIVDSWSSCPGDAVDRAHDALQIDTWQFVPLYVLALVWNGWYLVWSGFRAKTRMVARSAIIGGALAGGLDLVENAFLGQVVNGAHASATWATAASMPKWALLAVSVPVAVIGLLSGLGRLATVAFRGNRGRPEFFGAIADEVHVPAGGFRPGEPLGADVSESDAAARRAERPSGGPWLPAATGICLSGGGIRSASFALGAIQGLQSWPSGTGSVFSEADYLATVSGGGYTGTAAQILAHQSPTDKAPLAEGSSAMHLLRRGRRYMWGQPRSGARWQSTREFFTGVGIITAGIGFNLGVVVASLYVVAHPMGWALRVALPTDTVHRPLIPGVVIGTVLAALALSVILGPYLTRPGWRNDIEAVTFVPIKVGLGIVFALAALSIEFHAWYWVAIPCAAAFLRVSFRILGSARRAVLDTPDRAKVVERAPIWHAALSASLFAAIAVTGWYWFDQAAHLGPDGMVTHRSFVSLATVAVALLLSIAIGSALRVPLDWVRRKSPVWVSTTLLIVGIIASMITGAAFAIWWVWRPLGNWAVDGRWSDLSVWASVAAGLLVVYAVGDQKRWSPHPLYKARLRRTFALSTFGGPTTAEPGAMRLPTRTATTLSEWGTKPEHAPQLLICAAAYDRSVSRPDGLDAVPFVFSDSFVGSVDAGWARTVDFEATLGRRNQSDGTLVAAMAISGAAVSAAIGKINLGPLNPILAAFNLRLGVWLPGPEATGALRALINEHDVAAGSRSSTPLRPVPAWIRTRRISHLFKEIVGSYDLHARNVYVTDGGQFDNLGLYELLARRCETIYCFDASGDVRPHHGLNTATFDGTRELARRRLGVVFAKPGESPDGTPPTESGPGSPTTPGALTDDLCNKAEVKVPDGKALPSVGIAKDNVVVLDIRYPNDETPGKLVFAKCILSKGDEGSGAWTYAFGEGRHRFPSDSTVDQWLEEKQFDAYVDLGRSVAAKAVSQ